MAQNESSTQKIKGHAEDAGASVKDAAQNAAEAAQAEVTARTTRAKDGVASEINDTASALRRAADDVRDGSPQGTVFSYLADNLAEVADSVKGQDVSDMVGTCNDFARRNPLAFLGGAALLGFAATRFMKASDRPATAPGGTAQSRMTTQTGMAQPARPSTHSTAYNPNMPDMEVDNG